MQALENKVEVALAHGKLSGCVLQAISGDGMNGYSRTFGYRSASLDLTSLQSTDIFALISCSKIIVSVAILQLVERGLIGLDSDVGVLLPELPRTVIAGIDDHGSPVLEDRDSPIKLRDLLTHAAGLPYFHPLLSNYLDSIGKRPLQGATVAERFGLPQVAEPGESFDYGCSFDWLGKIIERLTESDLDMYVEENICNPLGITDIFFSMARLEDLQHRLVSTVKIDEQGMAVPDTQGSINDGITECFGGQSGHANLESLLTILQSLLSNDGRLLKPESATEMFKPQLSESSRRALNEQIKTRSGLVHLFTKGKGDYDWSFAGRVKLSKDGTVERTDWFGMMNTHWFIDHTRNFCGIFGTQLSPMGEPGVEKLCLEWVDAISHQHEAAA
ncbi:beta-lactamase/transpeptidase-like protein [Aureobasidium pullulans]|nr:beta-lactamase/transpeptidase-like protein [Aureobasidium pullulans]